MNHALTQEKNKNELYISELAGVREAKRLFDYKSIWRFDFSKIK